MLNWKSGDEREDCKPGTTIHKATNAIESTTGSLRPNENSVQTPGTRVFPASRGKWIHDTPGPSPKRRTELSLPRPRISTPSLTHFEPRPKGGAKKSTNNGTHSGAQSHLKDYQSPSSCAYSYSPPPFPTQTQKSA